VEDLRSLVTKPIGLGTANIQPYLNGLMSKRILHAALDAGISYFDTSPRYGLSQKFLGDHLPKNDHTIIATKVGLDPIKTSAVSIIGDQLKSKIKKPFRGLKSKSKGERLVPVNPSKIYPFDSFLNSIENSLRLLNRETLDVLHIHEPENIINLEELLDWVDMKRRAGLVRYRGLAIHRLGSNLLSASFDSDIIWQFSWNHRDLFAEKCITPIIFGTGRVLFHDEQPVNNLSALIQGIPRAIVLTQTTTPNNLQWVHDL